MDVSLLYSQTYPSGFELGNRNDPLIITVIDLVLAFLNRVPVPNDSITISVRVFRIVVAKGIVLPFKVMFEGGARVA
jgi:hypothetical protein